MKGDSGYAMLGGMLLLLLVIAIFVIIRLVVIPEILDSLTVPTPTPSEVPR